MIHLAKAKLNLFLLIKGKLTSGYHLVRSLIVPISLADEVEVEIIPGGKDIEVECHLGKDLLFCEENGAEFEELSGPGNIVGLAATEFLKSIDSQDGVKISITKNIPVGAGLGGGSSDAAAVLLSLNNHFKQPLTMEELAEIATNIGSDVVASLYNSLIFVHGTGSKSLKHEGLIEENRKITALKELGLVIVKPAFSISSQSAYQSLGFLEEFSNGDLEVDSPWKEKEVADRLGTFGLGFGFRDSALATSLINLTSDFGEGISGEHSIKAEQFSHEILAGSVNDFEALTFNSYPELEVLKGELESFEAQLVMLAGSGSSIVGFFDNMVKAEKVTKLLRERLSKDTFISSSRIVV